MYNNIKKQDTGIIDVQHKLEADTFLPPASGGSDAAAPRTNSHM